MAMSTQTVDGLTDAELDVLVEVAHLALDLQLFEQFDALCFAICRLRPDKPYPHIAVALGDYVRGRHREAIDRLHAVLANFPDAVYTRSLLARFMKELGDPGWERFAREALERSSQGVAADMAREVLGENGEAAGSETQVSAASQMIASRGLRV